MCHRPRGSKTHRNREKYRATLINGSDATRTGPPFLESLSCIITPLLLLFFVYPLFCSTMMTMFLESLLLCERYHTHTVIANHHHAPLLFSPFICSLIFVCVSDLYFVRRTSFFFKHSEDSLLDKILDEGEDEPGHKGHRNNKKVWVWCGVCRVVL